MKISADLFQNSHLKTFKQIDEMLSRPKGTAFRAFKRMQHRFIEGEHFYCVDARVDADAVAELRQAGKIYISTVNVVFITESGLPLLLAELAES
ncbi:MAG: ORF6N domain-containing protein [Gammaproteobacteria bacterium]